MSRVSTKADGVKQLILTYHGKQSLINLTPEEWEALKKFFGVEL